MTETTPPHPPKSGEDSKATKATVTFDWSEWLPYLADTDATPAQKRELIETLWSIVLAFVDLGYAVQVPPETRGQVPDLRADLALAMVNCDRKEAEHGDA